MKILDRYVLSTFLKNYLISFMVLVGLYVVLDMVINFDELAEIQDETGAAGIVSAVATLRHIGDYYFYQMFLIFAHLSGVIPVVAAAFTLMRFSRFNELVAMLAAGVPLLRIAMPVIIASLVLNALLLVDQELIVPRMMGQLIRKHDQVAAEATSFPIQAMQDDKNALLMVGRYHPPAARVPARMEELDVIERNADLEPVAHVKAASAQWDASQQWWVLAGGTRVTGLLPHERPSEPLPVESYQSNITPDEIALYRSGDFVTLLSTERINQLLQRPQSYGTGDLLRVKHARFTQPINNVILLLLAIPCVLTREPGRLRAAAVKCVILSGLCMASIFITQNLAGNPPAGDQWADRWPAIMAWAPIFIFGPISVWLLDRVKT